MPTLNLELQVSDSVMGEIDLGGMVNAMTSLYQSQADITVNTTINMANGMPTSVSVGSCDLNQHTLTSSQISLFNNFGTDSSNDVVALFVENITSNGSHLLGCSVHPVHPLKLRSIIGSDASVWVLAHEVAHNLGLEHVPDNSNIMFRKPQEIVEPVQITPEQKSTMQEVLANVQSGAFNRTFLFADDLARKERREGELSEAERNRPIRNADYSIVPLLRRFEEQVNTPSRDLPELVHLAAGIPAIARGDRRQSSLAALKVLRAASGVRQPVSVREAAAVSAWKLGSAFGGSEGAWELAALVSTLLQDDSRRVRRAATISAEALRLGYAATSTLHSPGSAPPPEIPSAELPVPPAEEEKTRAPRKSRRTQEN